MLANFMAEMKVSNESLRADMLTNNNTIINNMNKSNEAINDKFESLQAINAATREELLQKIDMRSRASSRASSRATSPTQVMAKLHAKLPELSNPAVVETPHMDYSNVQVSMTDIFKDKEVVNDVDLLSTNERTPTRYERPFTPSTGQGIQSSRRRLQEQLQRTRLTSKDR